MTEYKGLQHSYDRLVTTVKPFNMADLKFGDFTCKIILVNSNHTIPTQHTIQIKVGIVSTFAPFDFSFV